jgi:hypothetical protein
MDVLPEAIAVVSSERVDWPDASLGCPQPGLTYAEVTTPGYRIALRAADGIAFVHTDLEGRAVICTAEGVPAEFFIPVTPGEIDDGQPWLPAD